MPQPSTSRRQRLLLLAASLLAVVLLLHAGPAGAQDTTEPEPGGATTREPGATTTAPTSDTTEGGSTGTTEVPEGETGVKGVLKAGGDPVEGVLISVADAAGTAAGETESDAAGNGFVPLPAPGDYTVTLDASTLPAGVTLRAPDRNPLTVRVQGGRARAALFGLQVGDEAEERTAAPPRQTNTTVDRVADRLVNGIVFGLILAVASIGLSLVFGTTKLVNFAHGEMVTFGAIAAWFLSSDGDRLPFAVAGIIAMVLGMGVGAAQELGLWRPLRKRRTGQFPILVVSIGLSIAARQALLIWFGSGDRRYNQYVIQRNSWDIGPFNINARDIAIVVICMVILLGVAFMLQRTRVGKALRAVSDNPDLAASSGINVRRIILFVWILSGALAAGGGVLQGVAARIDYLMGFQLLLLMFAGVILGGLGTAYGAMVGGLIVGLTTELSTLWISPELKTVAALGVLILVLLVRPQGLLGSKERIG
ncbi:hypothetical protein BH24ACT4_BH24ACT4_15210 [soil metagenome]